MMRYEYNAVTGEVTEHDDAPIVERSDEDLASEARSQRQVYLAEADIAINKLTDSGGDATAWRNYRQCLRDIPSQVGFPRKINWPAMP